MTGLNDRFYAIIALAVVGVIVSGISEIRRAVSSNHFWLGDFAFGVFLLLVASAFITLVAWYVWKSWTGRNEGHGKHINNDAH